MAFDARLLEGINRRHKAGLSLTLIAAGAVLLSVTNRYSAAWVVPEAIGVVLVGTGATWLIGSLTGAHGLLFSILAFCIGLFLVAIPVWNQWQSYRAAFTNFQAEQKAKLDIGHAHTPTGSDGDLALRVRRVTNAMAARRGATTSAPDATERILDFWSSVPLEPPTFSLKGSVASHPVSSAGGCALAIFGLLVFISLLRGRPNTL